MTWEKRNKDEDVQFTEFEMNRPWDLLIDNSHANLNMDWVKKQVKWMMERETKNGI